MSKYNFNSYTQYLGARKCCDKINEVVGPTGSRGPVGRMGPTGGWVAVQKLTTEP